MKTATQQVGTPERTPYGWKIRSSSGDQMYEVEENAWGRWTCSCEDYWYRKRQSGGLCKHAAAVLSMLLDEEESLV